MPHESSVLRDLYVARGLRADAAQDAAIPALQRLYDAVISPPARRRLIGAAMPEVARGVYLHGPVGRGKSMMMDMFFAALPDTVRKRRVHFHAFMIEVHAFLHAARQDGRNGKGPDRALLRFAEKIADEARILCFDEFHVTDVADAMILSRLFTALLDRGIAVVMTSNWPPEKLYEGGLQRDRFLPFIALVRARMDVVAVDGPVDYRLRKLEDDGVYRHPLGASSRDWADTIFRELTGGSPPAPERMDVRGHVLEIPAAARGVARFSFADLCEKPLGAEDYLAIARAYHTVILENVPKLRYDRRNETKRLMILVDALYDMGARLVMTADAPPEKLYYGDEYAFEFQRTASRLIEMQSREWLEKTEVRQGP